MQLNFFFLPYPRLHLGRCSSLQLHCCDFRIFRNQSQLHHCEVQSLASAPSHSAAKVAFVKFVDRISGSFYRLTVSRAGGEQFSAYIKYSCCYQENHFPNRYKSMFYTRHKINVKVILYMDCHLQPFLQSIGDRFHPELPHQLIFVTLPELILFLKYFIHKSVSKLSLASLSHFEASCPCKVT